MWNPINNTGFDFSASSAGLFFHLIQVISYLLGLRLQSVQIISLLFWFALIVSAAFILAKTIFPKKKPVQLLFITLYSYNIYLFNSWENVKVANLSLVAGVPLGIALLLNLQRRDIRYPHALLYAALVGIIIMGAGINPAYLICFFATIFITNFLSLSEFTFSSVCFNLKNYLMIVVVILLINSFWLFPTADFILSSIGPAGSIDKIGFHSWIDSLSENTSLLNIMRLQGAWDWYAIDSTTMPGHVTKPAIHLDSRVDPDGTCTVMSSAEQLP